jgi:hypothetical protein
LALNNKVSEATGLTPFFANHGRHPQLATTRLPGPETPTTIIDVTNILQLHKDMAKQVNKVNLKTQERRQKKSKMAPQLKEGDKVYLLTKNLKTKRPSQKLDHKKVGPFRIKRVKGLVDFELDLPKGTRIHPVFYISLLEPVDAQTLLQTTWHYHPEDNKEFEVEEIVNHRSKNRRQEFLVKWKGYPDSDNTWELETNLANSRTLLDQYRLRSVKAN